MRKISLLLVMVLLLVAASVDAQKKGKVKIKPPVPAGTYTIQAEDGDGYFIFDADTGEFRCVMCEYGYIWNGTGTVKVEGVMVNFNCVTDQYRMLVTVNLFEGQGKAYLEINKMFSHQGEFTPFVERWTDLNISNSVAECKEE